MVLNRCSIFDNTRYGVWTIHGHTTLTDCLIYKNAQTGIRNAGGNVVVDNCIISENTFNMTGAGIYNSNFNHITGKMTLINITVSNNEAGSGGGGIFNGGELILIDSEVKSNIANSLGGGISNSGTGSINFINTTVSDNSAVLEGGGIHNSGTITLIDCRVSGNISQERSGGGISGWGVSLIKTKVSGNFAGLNGGGIETNRGTTNIENSTIPDNYSAWKGGGINSSIEATVAITNSTISGNIADDHGGGINSSGGPIVITNSTISGNTAVRGGGIGNNAPLNLNHVTLYENNAFEGSNLYNNNSVHAVVQINGSLIAGGIDSENCADTGTKYITDGGYNLDDDGTCNLTHETSLPNTYAGIDTLLADNGGFTKTHALLTDSLAIDWIPVGINGCGDTIVSDQRGAFRPQGDGCDIGAYELALVPDNQGPVVSKVRVQPNPDAVDSEITLTATIDDSQTGNSNIGWAQYNLNGGDWKPMYPVDAIFNSPIEEVFSMFSPTGSSHALHEICVRGGDVFDNISELFCMICYLDQAPFLCMLKPTIFRLMGVGRSND